MLVDLVDVSNVSPALFVTGAVFIMLIGSLLSIGVLKLFQQKRKGGIGYIGSAAAALVAFILVIEAYFV